MTSLQKVWVALIAVAIIAVGGYFFPQVGQVFGSIASATTYDMLGTSQLKVGTGCASGFKYSACTGTAVNQINYGQCIIHAYATTISASTTATVDCQAGTGAALSPLTGVTSGDTVMAMATTSISSTYLGVKILSANASTTAGYITMTLLNETGTTFTWTGAASSTISYLDFK